MRPTAQFPVGQLNPAAYGPLAVTIAAFIVAVILISSLASQRYAQSLPPQPARPAGLTAAIREISQTLRNRNFAVALVSGLLSAISASLFYGLTIYINTFVWGLPASAIMLLMFHTLIAAPLAWMCAPWLSEKLGKRTACVSLLSAFAVLGNLALLLRLLGWFPDNNSSLLLPTLWILTAMSGASIACGRIVQSSMIADIVEQQEARTGRRAEGLILSAESFLEKLMQGFATILPGAILLMVGFPQVGDPSGLDPEIVRSLLLVVVPMKFGLSALAALSWLLYRRKPEFER